MLSKPLGATTIDIYDGSELGLQFPNLNTFFTGNGYIVNHLSTSFSSLAGADFVILSLLGFSYTATPAQVAAIDSYVSGGGRLLINSDYFGCCAASITEANRILTSLGSSIVNLPTSSNAAEHHTADIVANPFTTGVHDVEYAATSSLTGGTALVYGNPVTDTGAEFVAYQQIGSGYVFIIADSNTADEINLTGENDNGILYCNFGGLSCAAAQTPVPEPGSIMLVGTRLVGVAKFWRRRGARTRTTSFI